MTRHGNLPLSDFEALEVEVAMTLACTPLPLKKRAEVEKRMEALRLRVGVFKPQ